MPSDVFKITKNAAKCTSCGEIVESSFGHDFRCHYCKINPVMGKKWEGEKLVPSNEITFNFAVDGGLHYLRRVGDPSAYEDVSEYEEKLA